MTRSWYKQNKKFLDAWADGKKIEIYDNGKYKSIENPLEYAKYNNLCTKFRIKPDIEYPIYAKHKDYDVWAKFTSEKKYKVIGGIFPRFHLEANMLFIGCEDTTEHPITDSRNAWEIIPNPYELHDKDPIWCWDDIDTTARELRFWDAKNNAAYSYDGVRDSIKFSNYDKVLPWDMQDWMVEAQKELED